MDKKFKKGDIVKGIDPHRYGITDTSMTKGKVIYVSKDGADIKVKIMEHSRRPSEVGEEYNVEAKYFALVEEAPKKVKTPKVEKTAEVHNSHPKFKRNAIKSVKTICIGGITIAIPYDCPVGISYKHPNDEPCEVVGESIAVARLMETVM